MTRSGRDNEEKLRKDSRFPHDNCNEGTAARTRPLSYDEIMLRRKSKKLSEDAVVGPVEASTAPQDNVGENGSNSFEPGRSKHEASDDMERCVQKETLKVSSRKKIENTPLKEDKADKGTYREDNTVRRHREAVTVKGKDRENREAVIKLKDKLQKDSVSKAKGGNDNQIQGRRRNDEHSSNVSVKETKKSHSRDFADKDKYLDRNRGKYGRDNNKRRYRDEDDDMHRDRITVKKHEPGRHRDYEVSERKERKESSQSLYDESRLKRRRSRSRGHDDRNRRSTSASPREHSRTFDYRRENVETTSHTIKERPERQHSNVDRGRISSNGLSNHYRRHGGPASGLGGYSPRKRRSETAIRTPSPIHHSPEKKNAGWDFPPTGPDSKLTGSVLPTLSSSNHTVSSNVGESVSAVPVALSTAKPLAGVSPIAISEDKSSSDSLQLTQATRPMRRLYIENVPASATEKAIMECLNNFLLSLDVNHIHGAHPCISCSMYKEKGQAVVEFLTPEDASAALSFDGNSFSGSILNIRRPKDFVNVATGDLVKSVAAVDTINDTVQDSPHKIFVGGISKALSSKMMMEILSAFGALKSYHFEVINGQPCAFLEYVDQSVTLKACAGLSGMKLGGQVLTAVQSVPHASSSLETTHETPSYGVPPHAAPLLKQPSQVLKLKNVLSADTLALLPESEVEEVLEDVRLECSRFGAVKSVNIIKESSSPTNASPGACTYTEIVRSPECFHNSGDIDKNAKSKKSKDVDHELGANIEESPANNKKTNKEAVKGDCIDDVDDLEEVKPPEHSCLYNSQLKPTDAEEIASKRNSPEDPSQMSTLKDCPDDTIQTELDLENKLSSQGDIVGSERRREIVTEDTKKGDSETSDPRCGQVTFERGSVLVEFRRTEASCMAAHRLHGRTFGGHTVAVEYVDVDLYQARFPK